MAAVLAVTAVTVPAQAAAAAGPDAEQLRQAASYAERISNGDV
ncbi:hypothetical protein [Amycolatopsis antarctica]|nr:hypothetical protein [Amycolatopsis antarctica]